MRSGTAKRLESRSGWSKRRQVEYSKFECEIDEHSHAKYFAPEEISQTDNMMAGMIPKTLRIFQRTLRRHILVDTHRLNHDDEPSRLEVV